MQRLLSLSTIKIIHWNFYIRCFRSSLVEIKSSCLSPYLTSQILNRNWYLSCTHSWKWPCCKTHDSYRQFLPQRYWVLYFSLSSDAVLRSKLLMKLINLVKLLVVKKLSFNPPQWLFFTDATQMWIFWWHLTCYMRAKKIQFLFYYCNYHFHAC